MGNDLRNEIIEDLTIARSRIDEAIIAVNNDSMIHASELIYLTKALLTSASTAASVILSTRKLKEATSEQSDDQD